MQFTVFSKCWFASSLLTLALARAVIIKNTNIIIIIIAHCLFHGLPSSSALWIVLRIDSRAVEASNDSISISAATTVVFE